MELGEVVETERKPNFWMVGIHCVQQVSLLRLNDSVILKNNLSDDIICYRS